MAKLATIHANFDLSLPQNSESDTLGPVDGLRFAVGALIAHIQYEECGTGPSTESKMPSPHAEVDAFLSETTHPLVANVQHLRVVILASDPRITERITWNAPSFGLGNSDPVTMNLRSRDAVMLMFHRGVKPKPFADFAFDDPSRLLKWAAPDCATATFRSLDAFESIALDLRSLVVRWITATTWAGFPRFKRPYVFQPPHSAANSNVELDYE